MKAHFYSLPPLTSLRLLLNTPDRLPHKRQSSRSQSCLSLRRPSLPPSQKTLHPPSPKPRRWVPGQFCCFPPSLPQQNSQITSHSFVSFREGGLERSHWRSSKHLDPSMGKALPSSWLPAPLGWGSLPLFSSLMSMSVHVCLSRHRKCSGQVQEIFWRVKFGGNTTDRLVKKYFKCLFTLRISRVFFYKTGLLAASKGKKIVFENSNCVSYVSSQDVSEPLLTP